MQGNRFTAHRDENVHTADIPMPPEVRHLMSAEPVHNAHVHFSVGTQTRASWFSRAWQAVLAFFVAYVRVSDPEWHKTVRQTAGTVLFLAFVVASLFLLWEGALWVQEM